jgi:hypothetical protein
MNELSIQELRQVLREKGLNAKGNRKQLFSRLQQSYSLPTDNQADASSHDTETNLAAANSIDSTIKYRVTLLRQGSSRCVMVLIAGNSSGSKLIQQLLANASNKFRFKAKKLFHVNSAVEINTSNITEFLCDNLKLLATAGENCSSKEIQLINNSASTLSPVIAPSLAVNQALESSISSTESKLLDIFDLTDCNSIHSNSYAETVDKELENSTSNSINNDATGNNEKNINIAAEQTNPLHKSMSFPSNSPLITSSSSPSPSPLLIRSVSDQINLNKELEGSARTIKRLEAVIKQQNKQISQQNEQISASKQQLHDKITLEVQYKDLLMQLDVVQKKEDKNNREKELLRSKNKLLLQQNSDFRIQLADFDVISKQNSLLLQQLSNIEGKTSLEYLRAEELQGLLLLHAEGMARVSQFITKQNALKVKLAAEANKCKICMVHAVDTLFLPCLHYISCGKCAARLQKCAVCMKPIDNCQPIYT